MFGEYGFHAFLQQRTEFFHTVVGRFVEHVQCRSACGHGQWIARERAGLIDRAERREFLHDFGSRTVGTHGQAATDDFAKRRDVGGDTAQVAIAPLFETEPADDLIEHQKRSVGVAKLAKTVQKFWALHQEAVVSGERFNHDGSDLVPVFREEVFHRFEVVKRADERRGHRVLRNAGAAGDTEGGQSASRRHHQGVNVAVVATLKLHKNVPPGETSGQSNGAHDGFSTR